MPKNVCNICTCKDMGYCCKIKLTVIFEHLVKQGWNFRDILMFIRTFDNDLIKSKIFSSKVVNTKLPKYLTAPSSFKCYLYHHQTVKIFQKLTTEFHSSSGSKTTA